MQAQMKDLAYVTAKVDEIKWFEIAENLSQKE